MGSMMGNAASSGAGQGSGGGMDFSMMMGPWGMVAKQMRYTDKKIAGLMDEYSQGRLQKKYKKMEAESFSEQAKDALRNRSLAWKDATTQIDEVNKAAGQAEGKIIATAAASGVDAGSGTVQRAVDSAKKEADTTRARLSQAAAVEAENYAKEWAHAKASAHNAKREAKAIGRKWIANAIDAPTQMFFGE